MYKTCVNKHNFMQTVPFLKTKPLVRAAPVKCSRMNNLETNIKHMENRLHTEIKKAFSMCKDNNYSITCKMQWALVEEISSELNDRRQELSERKHVLNREEYEDILSSREYDV